MRRQVAGEKEKGQATIEFTLVLILLLAFVFFFVQLSLVFGWASYIQYGTYLVARSFAAAGQTPSDMSARGEAVAAQMYSRDGRPRAAFLAQDDGGGANGRPARDAGFQENIRDYSWMEGVRYSFKSKVFLLPLGRNQPKGDGNFLHLKSEAWLSREPADSECNGQMRNNYYDNGC